MPRPARHIIIPVAAILMLFMAACGSSSTGSGALAANQFLTLPNIAISEIGTMDPALPSDLNSAESVQMVFSGLVSLDPKTLAVVPDMATELPSAANGGISSDGMTYTFHLKPNLEFSNGDPVTASTFAYSIDRALDPKLKSNVATVYLGAIKGAMDRAAGNVQTIIGTGVVATDPTTLTVTLASPIAYFLQAMTYSTSFAVDELQKNANPNDPSYSATWTDNPIGTGPFEQQSWTHNSQQVFVTNPHWYGTPSKITKVTMPFIKDVETAYSEYKAKQLDMDGLGYVLSSNDYVDAKTNLANQLSQGPFLEINYVAPNWNVAPFTDKRVRQAFAYATDRATITHNVLKDSQLVSDNIVPQGMPGYDASPNGLSFNPTMAKQLIQAAYPDISKFPQVTLTFPQQGDNAKIAAELQSEYQTYLGVNIQLNGEDFEKLVNDVYTNAIQFYMLAWIADYPDPQDWTSLQFTMGAPNNTMNFNDPAFDALTNKGDVDPNSTSRFSEYNQAQDIALQDVGWVPYTQQKNTYVTQTWVKGFTVDAGGLIPNSVWAGVSVLQH